MRDARDGYAPHPAWRNCPRGAESPIIRPMRALGFVLAIGLLPAAGCALRDAPYRFRAPGVSGVQAGDLESRDDAASPANDGDRRDGMVASAAHLGFAELERPAPRTGPVPAADALADTLRGMVGLREPDATEVGFVMAALATLGAALDDDLRAVADGPALVAIAEARNATEVDHQPLLGDLVVFDDVVRKAAASAIGVVVARRDDGTVELVYLSRGVVRRGFMNREHPDQKRDAEDRVLNTIIRQRHGSGRKGHGDLTAQVFATYIRLDALSDR